jgi:hypothetical protein
MECDKHRALCVSVLSISSPASYDEGIGNMHVDIYTHTLQILSIYALSHASLQLHYKAH